MTKDSQLRCRAKRVHDKVKQGGVRVRGPISQLFEVADSLGWSWDDFEKFKRVNESDLPLRSSAPTAGEVWKTQLHSGVDLVAAAKAVEVAKDLYKFVDREWLHDVREALRLREWRVAQG